eukprot:TRINITY_DN10357_c0_g1_i1.p2 TRINITY_DN10357_c0_g1~~TRINITY_DN10357_c0_g1_i1.p2  ORF type:complete len:131 (-),score=29.42 TRINITY_DN10357_c0_g1_i1:523-915(-)
MNTNNEKIRDIDSENLSVNAHMNRLISDNSNLKDELQQQSQQIAELSKLTNDAQLTLVLESNYESAKKKTIAFQRQLKEKPLEEKMTATQIRRDISDKSLEASFDDIEHRLEIINRSQKMLSSSESKELA